MIMMKMAQHGVTEIIHMKRCVHCSSIDVSFAAFCALLQAERVQLNRKFKMYNL